jgi:hypothetical protein
MTKKIIAIYLCVFVYNTDHYRFKALLECFDYKLVDIVVVVVVESEAAMAAAAIAINQPVPWPMI